MDLSLHHDGMLVIDTGRHSLELGPAAVLALGDFLALTERVWRP